MLLRLEGLGHFDGVGMCVRVVGGMVGLSICNYV